MFESYCYILNKKKSIFNFYFDNKNFSNIILNFKIIKKNIFEN